MRLHKAYLTIPLRKVNLMPGTTGSIVFSLQKRLQELGYLSPAPTGIYDQATQNAIGAYQASHNLPQNGITDWKTFLYIWREAESEITPQNKAVAQAATNTSIHIARSARTLSVYTGNKLHGQYPIAVGKPHTPTPLGNYAIATKITNPGGVLGTRWMGLNFDSYGIHGTNRPWLIGQAVSLGCIRMHNENIENVFNNVHIGTPVYIRE
jgi:lipoprotein-anchoring transpeptidase ErfK/SrfK